MSEIKKQFRGYDMQIVDNLIVDYESQIGKLKREVAALMNLNILRNKTLYYSIVSILLKRQMKK